MPAHAPRLFPLAALLLILGASTRADDAAKPLLPAGEYDKLVQPSVKVILAALEGKPTLRSADKARVTAVMLAEFAQQDLSGDDGPRRARARDAALEVAELIKNKKYPEARQRIGALPSLPADPNAKLEKMKLFGPHLDLEELMSQFRESKRGGLDIEPVLDQLGTSKGELAPEALTESLLLLAYRTAVAAELAREHTPKMQQKEWQDFADGMRKSAAELAESIKTRDGKAAFKAVTQLNNSCTKCHRVFRNNN